MQIIYIGNFSKFWCTENDIAYSLSQLGHDILKLQENETSFEEILKHQDKADFILYTRTWDNIKGDQVDFLEKKTIPMIGLSLDLYFGLKREADLENKLLWKSDCMFTADGGHQKEFKQVGINHFYLPAGVVGTHTYLADPVKEIKDVNGKILPVEGDVAFVGSIAYHGEYQFRKKLINWLGQTYSNFKHWGQSHAVRGDDLNSLYASVKVVVGDSLDTGKKDYWCVDDKTQILTKRGWLSYKEIRQKDVAYTINPETFKGEWNNINNLTLFPKDKREMISMEGERHSSLTTPNHRWITERRQLHKRKTKEDYRWIGRDFRFSKDLTVNDYIPVSAPCVELPKKKKYSDDFVELVSWAWTEGSVSNGRYTTISQSHKINLKDVKNIRKVLQNIYGNSYWSENKSNNGMTIFGIFKKISDDLWKVSPDHCVTQDFILSLTKPQLRLFIEKSIDADGCRKKSKKNGVWYKSKTIAQKDSKRLDSFEMACALLGIATNRNHYPCDFNGKPSKDGILLVQLKRRKYTAPVKSSKPGRGKVKINKIIHNGIVWCPSTNNKTWLARRNGKVYFTGNSDRVYETVGRGGFLLFPYCKGLEKEFKLGYLEDVKKGKKVDLVIYERENLNQLKETIDYFLKNEKKRVEIMKRGHKIVKDNFTYKHRMKRMLDTLEKGGYLNKITWLKDKVPTGKVPKILNLGSGLHTEKGQVNLDIYNFEGTDVIHDLNNFPYPFTDCQFDKIVASDVLEHLDDVPKVMNELYRIMQTDGILEIRVPDVKYPEAVWDDPTHKRGFTKKTFDYWDHTTPFGKEYGQPFGDKFRVLERKEVNKGLEFKLKRC